MAKKHINVMLTAFRDGFQSVYGARVLTNDFLPAVEAAKHAGIRHFESAGGARFQSLYFYCNEDAFDMMDSFRKTVGPDINLQSLSRGINVVGLESQSSDIIKLHAKLFKKHGITTVRNFDALNDVNNLIYSGKCINEAGLYHEAVITLMARPSGNSEAHTPAFYIKTLKKFLDADIKFNSLCFKDASGTATPAVVYETIKMARKMLGNNKPIRFHTHETAGISVLQYKSALDAGADGIDLSMAPVSGGTAQPDIITMWHALKGTDYDLGVDIKKIMEAEKIFKECMKDYFIPPEAKSVMEIIPFSPMPGGALTANTQMMRDNNILNKFNEIIEAMHEVVKRGGFGTSVTPVSQFYFQQAFNNVMFGPWKKIAEGYGNMVLGYFGHTPVAPDPEIIKLASSQLNKRQTSESPLKINDRDHSKGVVAAQKILKAQNLPQTDETVFIVATCKEKGVSFLKGHGKIMVRKTEKQSKPVSKEKSDVVTVSIEGKDYIVQLNNNQAVVNGQSYDFKIFSGSEKKPAVQEASDKKAHIMKAPVPGFVVKIIKQTGARLKTGDTILILEAMKMETDIKTPVDGILTSIDVSEGSQVSTGDILAKIS